MITQLPVRFLQEKIQELQSALFFTDTDSVLRMPTHVVNAVEVDEAGHIWFIVPRPTQHIDVFEKEFPAKLDFFRKGKGFYLKIQGKASLVEDRREINALAHVPREARQRIEQKRAIAVKVKIQNADYFENKPVASKNWILNRKNHLFNWLFNAQYDYKNPQLICIPITLD